MTKNYFDRKDYESPVLSSQAILTECGIAQSSVEEKEEGLSLPYYQLIEW